jgi:hypothetical protein
MADDQPTIAKPEAWWGVIQGAAREHLTTAETWDRINAYSQSEGLAIPSDMFQQVNRMRGLASGLTYGSERLMAADPTDAITERMIGQQVYARSGEDMTAISALYHVRFEMTTMTALGPQTGWYTMDYGNQLPSTIDELQADLEDYGQGLSDSYGQEYGSIGAIEIGAW